MILMMVIKGRIEILLSFLICIVLVGRPSYSQTDKLQQGQLLKDGEELHSAYGNFRLGFFSPDHSTTKRYLGIWYHRPTYGGYRCDPTYAMDQCDNENGIQAVWVANRNTPISDKSGRLTIDSRDGNLKILHSGGDPIVISSIQAVGNTSATLDKSGNFVLCDMNSNGSIRRQLWQSFDYPTDTLLPGMKLGIDLQNGHNWSLSAGSFTLGLHPNDTKKLAIIRAPGVVEWTSGVWLNGSFDDSSPGYYYNFSYTSSEQGIYFNYSVNEDVTSFPALILDPMGELYTGETELSICEVFGGCIYDYFNNIPEAYKEKEWWRRPQLIVGVVIPLLVLILCFLCYHLRRKYKAKEEKWWQSLGIVSVIPLLCYLCYLMLKKLKAKVESMWNRWKLLRELGDKVLVPLPISFRKGRAQERDQRMKHEMKIFDFQVIAAATDNFSTTNKLGQGGFGPVYKGTLSDGQEIAIKKLSKSSGQGIVEFKNEAKLIAKLQHTNLVRLLGCSLHGGERFLVYEYMPNKSLDFFIFDYSRKNLLSLKKRLNIIDGIAQGLIYLHKYSRLKVIHRDLKASNILLDDQMNPKISDFGMARAFGVNELETNTNRIVGTHGYMSPEYVMNGIVSMKTDVYSFGVMVLEILTNKKNNGCYDTDRPLNLVGYAWQLWNEGRGLELIDQMDESSSHKEVLRCLHLGLLCVQDRATDRPTMSEVVSMLSNENIVLPAPKQPAFFINVTSDEPQVSENHLQNCSANNVTISVMEPR